MATECTRQRAGNRRTGGDATACAWSACCAACGPHLGRLVPCAFACHLPCTHKPATAPSPAYLCVHSAGVQVARAEVGAAKGQLAQLQQLHAAEASAARAHLQRLVAHMEATQPEALPVLLPAELLDSLHADAAHLAAAAPRQGQAAVEAARASQGAALSREAELLKAVEASETAVAVMQSRLLQALQVCVGGRASCGVCSAWAALPRQTSLGHLNVTRHTACLLVVVAGVRRRTPTRAASSAA